MNSSDRLPLEFAVIGLTGGIGTGKSTAARYLAQKGLAHIDADAISRQLTHKEPGVPNPVLERIGEAFAEKVLDEDGALDRAAMAGIVFGDPAKKKLLESILFEEIILVIRRQIREAREKAVSREEEEGSIRGALLDAPLLFEADLQNLCDVVIVLTAEHDIRMQRIMERDGCGPEEVEARIRNQMSDEQKLALADYSADNSGDRKHLHDQLDRILEDIFGDKNA